MFAGAIERFLKRSKIRFIIHAKSVNAIMKEMMQEKIRHIIQKVQINIPFTMLVDTHLDAFIKNGLNPEIGLDAAALDRFKRADFSRIARQFHNISKQITLHGPFMDLSAGSPDPAVRRTTRQRFEQLLELVPLFKPKSVICHAGYDAKRYGYLKDAWVENSLEMWSWLAAEIATRGSRLMLENVFEDGPDDMLILFNALETLNVGFCLDSGHSHAFGQSDLELWLQVLGPYLGQLHLHDNFGHNDEHLAMGRGTIDFNNILKYLKKNKASAPIITLEPHREKDLWPSLAYLADRWPW
jgi:sugar phosphate isomerase/epimerase